MEKRIREQFSPQILAEAAARFGVKTTDLQELGGFESYVYSYTQHGQGRILRVSHSLHRSADMTRGEVDFINYLADRGVPAARAYPALSGELVEMIPCADGHFSAVSFERAPGQPPALADWINGLPRQLGRVAGRMNRLAQGYQPPQPAWRRPEAMTELRGFAEAFLPPDQTRVIQRWNELLDELEALPRDSAQYGLVHQDLHGGNFFVNDGQITLFDFDDCQYAWYAYDIAMAYFYVLPHHCETPQHLDDARSFIQDFLAGYAEERPLDPAWLKLIPRFLKLREIDLYIAIHRSEDLNHLDDWCASYMRGRRENIESGAPYFPDVLNP